MEEISDFLERFVLATIAAMAFMLICALLSGCAPAPT